MPIPAAPTGVRTSSGVSRNAGRATRAHRRACARPARASAPPRSGFSPVAAPGAGRRHAPAGTLHVLDHGPVPCSPARGSAPPRRPPFPACAARTPPRVRPDGTAERGAFPRMGQYPSDEPRSVFAEHTNRFPVMAWQPSGKRTGSRKTNTRCHNGRTAVDPASAARTAGRTRAAPSGPPGHPRHARPRRAHAPPNLR
jgi:hypothetical protein